jgi:hypothetical protein
MIKQHHDLKTNHFQINYELAGEVKKYISYVLNSLKYSTCDTFCRELPRAPVSTDLTGRSRKDKR